MSDPPLADARDRARAESDLDHSFAVEAAAGAGKTSVLVTRLLNLVGEGKSPLDRIVAVTFTEKAAGELKMRVRERIEAALDGALDATRRESFEKAIEALGHAPIGTIHGFCSGLLRERPVEAGVDPQFQVADELAASLLRERVWTEWLEAELTRGNPALLRALAHGLRLDGEGNTIRALADKMLDCRDLLAGRPRPRAPGAGDGSGGPGVRDFIRYARPKLAALADMVRSYSSGDRSEAFASQLEEAQRTLLLAEGLTDAHAETTLMTLKLPYPFLGQAHWGRKEDFKAAQERFSDLKQRLNAVKDAVGPDLAASVGEALVGYVEACQRAKDEEGLLDFNDLLLVTRNMLAGSREARDHFKRRYDYLLVDEFQDTDPLQVEIVLFLAERLDRHAAAWDEAEVQPGKLFIVGDPKQSIYRFRRADIEIYEKAKHTLCRWGEELILSVSFRPVPGVAEAVNHIFGGLIRKPDDGDWRPVARRSPSEELRPSGSHRAALYQPSYVPLVPYRPPTGPVAGSGCPRPAVVLLYPPPELSETLTNIDLARRAEARCVAALIRRIVEDEHWEIQDPRTKERKLRPVQYGDIAILAERFTFSDRYAEALAAAGVPLRVVGGRHFYVAHEVHSLVAVLRALDNPHDRLSLVAALRGPFFGVSDDELLLATLQRGPLSYLHEGHSGPLGEAIAILRELHERRDAEAIPLLLQRLFARTKVLELFCLRPRGEQQVANLLKIVDQARALEATSRVSFRGFVRWLSRLHETEARETESPSSEPGDNYVQFLSVHGAKGLEFPVVFLADMTKGRGHGASFLVLRDRSPAEGQFAFRLADKDSGFVTPNWPSDDYDRCRSQAEDVRLFYVAATRARDLLFLTPGWGEGAGGPAAFLGDLANPDSPPWGTQTPAGFVYDTRTLDAGERDARPFRLRPPTGTRLPAPARKRLAAREEWRQGVAALLAEAHGGVVVRAPSHLGEGPPPVAKEESHAEPAEAAEKRAEGIGPKSQIGNRKSEMLQAHAGSEQGRRIGSLVHRCLERAGLDTAAAIEATLDAEAKALDLSPGATAEARRLLQVALDSPLLARARAAAARYHEVPFFVKVGGVVLSGAIDLLFLEDDGAVIVDFKTDAVRDEAEVARRAEAYRPQVLAYALAVDRILCKPVKEVILSFLSVAREWSVQVTEEVLREAADHVAGGQ